MAGTGKGALRIAIEDFLETFDFPKIWFNWLKKVIEQFELEAVETYEDLANQLGLVQYLPDGLKPSVIRSRMTKRPIQIVPILVGIAMMMLGLFVGMLQPLQRMGSYKVDALVKSGRPSPQELWRMAWLVNLEQGNPSQALKDLGFDETYIEGYKRLARSYLSPHEYIDAWRKGYLSDTEFTNKLLALGYSREDINIFINQTKVLPSVSDLIRMAVREAFSENVVRRFGYDQDFPTEILEHTRKLGLSDDWVRRYWFAHWELPSPTAGYEMLHRLRPNRSKVVFTKDDLETLLRVADYPPKFREALIAISYNPITRVDIRRMYKLGVIDAQEVKERYMDLGYTEEDAKLLAEFTVKYESGSSEDKDDEIKGISESLAKRLYQKKLITRDEYKTRLLELKYPSDIAERIIKLADEENRVESMPDYRQDAVRDMIEDVRKAFANRMITEETARSTLASLGLSGEVVDYIIKSEQYQAELSSLAEELKVLADAYLSGVITENELVGELGRLNLTGSQQNKILNDLHVQTKYRTKRLTESQYRTAWLRGIITEEDYKQSLVHLGYSDKDIELLVKLYKQEEE